MNVNLDKGTAKISWDKGNHVVDLELTLFNPKNLIQLEVLFDGHIRVSVKVFGFGLAFTMIRKQTVEEFFGEIEEKDTV